MLQGACHPLLSPGLLQEPPAFHASYLSPSNPFFTQHSRCFYEITQWTTSLLWLEFFNLPCWAVRRQMLWPPCLYAALAPLSHTRATLNVCFLVLLDLFSLLGTVTSRLVAEVVPSALNNSHDSFSHCPTHWSLPFYFYNGRWFFSCIVLLFTKYLFSTNIVSCAVLSPLGGISGWWEGGKKNPAFV